MKLLTSNVNNRRSTAAPRRRGHLSAVVRALGLLREHLVLMLGVVCPTVTVAAYFLLAATPIFVSESKFVVRLSSPPSRSPLGGLLQSSGITKSQDDTFSVSDFLLSRDAFRQVNDNQSLAAMFSPPQADFLARYPRPWDSRSFEGLYRYYLSRVEVAHNSSTGVTTLRTRAFSARDAFVLNSQLLSSAGELLARLNNRAREDAVSFSRREVANAETRLLNIQGEITKFRNNEMMIDPARLSLVMLDTIGRLSTELAITRARLSETEASAPGSAIVPSLNGRIAALEEQVDRERMKLVGNDASVAVRIAGYEQLVLKREMASKALSLATASLESARSEAQRQQLYLEPIVRPNDPDEAIEPLGAKYVLVTFFLGAVVSLIAWILWMAAAEHARNRKLLRRSGFMPN